MLQVDEPIVATHPFGRATRAGPRSWFALILRLGGQDGQTFVHASNIVLKKIFAHMVF